MKMLFITAHYPSKNARYAGHKIAYQTLLNMSKVHEHIDVLVICNSEEEDKSLLDEFSNVRLVKFIPLTMFSKLSNILWSGSLFPLKFNSRLDRTAINYISENISIYSHVHFEFTHAAVLINTIKEHARDIVYSISCHDVVTQSVIRKEGLFFTAIELLTTYRLEQNILNEMQSVYVFSEKDKELIRSLFSIDINKIIVIKPMLSEFVYKLNRNSLVKRENALIYWGAMNRKENEDAILSFLDLFLPYLIEHDITLYIVGASPSSRVTSLSSENIVVTGFLDDPSDFFLKSKIGIVPLTYGAGIKIKTLELLEAGLPVLSTPIGAEGIEHHNLTVVDLVDFEKALSKLL